MCGFALRDASLDRENPEADQNVKQETAAPVVRFWALLNGQVA
jgi:hypothetical protein